jgi:glycosyltransferase involved in cell wall biosynthesis
MDLGYLEFSGQFNKITFWQLKYWSAISIYVSKYIIAISNATKQDIVRHYPFASGKVKVTLLAYDVKRFNTSIDENLVRRIKSKYAIVDDYVLYLGTLKPSKNIEGLIRGFAHYLDNNPTDNKTMLVIGGKKGWMFDSIFEVVKECGLENRVKFPGFIEEKDKPAILTGAKLFTSPSFWEGFGLHVLESMACGTPSLVSNVGSLPEVASDAGVYCDPYDYKSIGKGIGKVLGMDEKRYNKLVEEGIAQAGKFSWEDTARKTVNILEKVK